MTNLKAIKDISSSCKCSNSNMHVIITIDELGLTLRFFIEDFRWNRSYEASVLDNERVVIEDIIEDFKKEAIHRYEERENNKKEKKDGSNS